MVESGGRTGERRRRVSNPLALAVLGVLIERPMHPYEMSSTMRHRRKEWSIKLNYGSLYSVIGRLEAHGMIEATETVREGNRPERTVYAITPAGQAEFEDWLAELLGIPVKEYPQYEAGLTLLAALSPDRAVELLEQRCIRIRERLEQLDVELAEALTYIPQLFIIETDYTRAMMGAELDWTRRTIEEITSGRLEGIDIWRYFYEPGRPEPSWLPDSGEPYPRPGNESDGTDEPEQ